jgi:hypothetical protein
MFSSKANFPIINFFNKKNITYEVAAEEADLEITI